MKRYLNEYSTIGLAIFIALAIPSLCSMLNVGLNVIMPQEPTVQEKIKEINEPQDQASFRQILVTQKKEGSLFSYIVLAIALLLFAGAFFITNPFIQVGFYGGILLSMSLYESSMIASIALFILFLACAKTFLNDRSFSSAYFKSSGALIIALIIFLAITFSFVYLYDPEFLVCMLLYVTPLIIAAYFIPYPMVSVGLIYAAAFLSMQELRVFFVGPNIANNLMALLISLLAVLCIFGQNILRERFQKN